MRTLRKPQWFVKNPILLFQNFLREIFIVHGSADDNVHVQDTMRIGRALVRPIAFDLGNLSR